MPTVGNAPPAESEKAWPASMTSLPGFAKAVASGYTKNGAPLPTRFCTAMSLSPAGVIAANGSVSAVSFMTFGATVVHWPAAIATWAHVLADVLATVPTRTPFTASCAPTAKPLSTHDAPSVRVMYAERPPSGEVSVTETPSSCANGFGPKMPSDSTSVRPPYHVPSCDVSPYRTSGEAGPPAAVVVAPPVTTSVSPPIQTFVAGLPSNTATVRAAFVASMPLTFTIIVVPSPYDELSKSMIVAGPTPSIVTCWPPAKPSDSHGCPSRRVMRLPLRSNAALTNSSSRTAIVSAAPATVPRKPTAATTFILLFAPYVDVPKPVMVNVFAPIWIVWPTLKPCVIQSTPSVRVIDVAVVSNVPVTVSAVLPPPCTVVMPPCAAARAVPLFACSIAPIKVPFTVKVSLPWPRKRFRTSIVETPPSVTKLPAPSTVYVPYVMPPGYLPGSPNGHGRRPQ